MEFWGNCWSFLGDGGTSKQCSDLTSAHTWWWREGESCFYFIAPTIQEHILSSLATIKQTAIHSKQFCHGKRRKALTSHETTAGFQKGNKNPNQQSVNPSSQNNLSVMHRLILVTISSSLLNCQPWDTDEIQPKPSPYGHRSQKLMTACGRPLWNAISSRLKIRSSMLKSWIWFHSLCHKCLNTRDSHKTQCCPLCSSGCSLTTLRWWGEARKHNAAYRLFKCRPENKIWTARRADVSFPPFRTRNCGLISRLLGRGRESPVTAFSLLPLTPSAVNQWKMARLVWHVIP